MSYQPPTDRISVTERLANVVKALSLTNVLIIALLVIIAVPSYFAYRFMADEDFRREFLASAVVIDKHVPCVVLEGKRFGGTSRHTMLYVYGREDRFEKIIGLRAPGTLTDSEIEAACSKVLLMANEMKR